VTSEETTQRLACDGMLDEADAMIARIEAATEVTLGMLRRHRAALASCRQHCWLRSPAGDAQPGGGTDSG
jgi:hypothetical protein